jgi:hypothetical protein
MVGNFTRVKLNPIRYAMSMTVSLPHGSVSCRIAGKHRRLWNAMSASIIYQFLEHLTHGANAQFIVAQQKNSGHVNHAITVRGRKGEPMGAYDCDCINNLEYDRRERKAQLSKEGTTKGATSDLISRMETVEHLRRMLEATVSNTDYDEGYIDGIEFGISTVSTMPPAQPEALTDKEQRIFLAAMGREEKVCRQVDDECRDCREPYEDSLVRTCHEITRKVKGALWT